MFLQVEKLRDEADKAKRDCLEVKKIAEEKEVLLKQEQAALRKVRFNGVYPNEKQHDALLSQEAINLIQYLYICGILEGN